MRIGAIGVAARSAWWRSDRSAGTGAAGGSRHGHLQSATGARPGLHLAVPLSWRCRSTAL